MLESLAPLPKSSWWSAYDCQGKRPKRPRGAIYDLIRERWYGGYISQPTVASVAFYDVTATLTWCSSQRLNAQRPKVVEGERSLVTVVVPQ